MATAKTNASTSKTKVPFVEKSHNNDGSKFHEVTILVEETAGRYSNYGGSYFAEILGEAVEYGGVGVKSWAVRSIDLTKDEYKVRFEALQ